MRKYFTCLMVLVGLIIVVGCASDKPAACTGSDKAAPAVTIDKPAAVVQAVAANYLKPDQAAARDKSFIVNWQVLGPFSYEEKSYKNEDGSQEAVNDEFVKNEAELAATPDAKELCGKAWKKYNSADSYDGLIDLNAMYSDPDYVTAYMCANVFAPADMEGCKLPLGSDDYIKVWVNGKVVHVFNKERRAAEQDNDTSEAFKLKKGCNTITIKCVDVILGWGVYCRIVDGKGNPIVISSTN